MNHATQCLALSLAILLGGCASEPKQIAASIPLVNQTATDGLIALPAEQQQVLNSLQQGNSVAVTNGTFTPGPVYTSALGHACRELLFQRSLSNGASSRSEKRIACQRADQWYLIPQLEQLPVNSLQVVESN